MNRYVRNLIFGALVSPVLFNTVANAADAPPALKPEAPASKSLPTPPASVTSPGAAEAFVAPYPDRTNPFQMPDNKAALATRRDAVVQQIDLHLKGFVNSGDGTRAVVLIDGVVTSLGADEKRGDLQVLEIAPPVLTLQRGRHRWSESIVKPSTNKAASPTGR
jgi:hypothetical protein